MTAQSPSRTVQARTAAAPLLARVPKSAGSLPVDALTDACSGDAAKIQVVAAGTSLTETAVTATRAAEVIVEFDTDNAKMSERDRKILAAALEANAKNGLNKVRIYAGRGGDGNIFERAAIAERRARLVKQLVPPRMVASMEFDPLQADDTVRVEFVSAP